MNNFLKHCKNVFNTKLPRVVVIGNESCDLDSAVCCISLAYHLSRLPSFLQAVKGCDRIVPVLNVSREDLPLKTEVVYYLKENQIDLLDLVCKDEIDLPEEQADNGTSYVLVDHHLSKYRSSVVGVIDHRPFDASSMLNDGIFKRIEQVGSCASLVTKIVEESGALKNAGSEDNTQLLKLLYGAIVLDTVNFSKQADKARELDHQMAGLIERQLGIQDSAQNRQELFDKLVAKRNDIADLDSLQILSKDLKIVSRNGRVVAIPGYPILVQDYIKLENAKENLQAFARKNGCNVIILMGMKVNSKDSSVRRDLGIINIDDRELFDQIISTISSCTAPDFCLGKHDDVDFLEGAFYEQSNVKASRKQLLPLINNVLDNRA